jgi:hypothetical protein
VTQARLALNISKVILECMLQIARCPPELPHDLPDIPRQFRQLFRSKHHQNYHENYNQVWNAEHWGYACRFASRL